ncbi:MAG: hypothetical protein LBU18_00310 [Treponema sp.]|jgi:hypothetical protein|nr:hypothetical protein [Treponema sp.]
MVKGNWIVFLKEMRCKNWVNGIDVGFYFDKTGRIEGKIQYLPPRLLEQISLFPNPGVFLFRMRYQAALIFRKIYLKRQINPKY